MGTREPPFGVSALRGRDTGQSLRRRSRDESGSILVIFALFLTVFLLIAAAVVDVGYWWVNGKKAQIAADACALAAARELPQTWDSPPRADCTFGGRDYVLHNLPAETNTEGGTRWRETRVFSPYDTDEFKVEATVRVSVRTFFGRFVGLDQIHVTRRAVAEQSFGTSLVTIHAHDTNCGNDALVINGKDNVVEGLMESNGKFEWNGENFTSGPATAGGPNNCLIKVNGPGASFGGQPAPANDPVPHPWPAYYVPWENGFECDFNKQNFKFDTDNAVLVDGVYCATEDFEISGKNITGNITVLSPLIKIGGEGTNLAPSSKAIAAGKPLLFFHIPNSTLGQGGDTAGQPDDLDPPYCEFSKEMILNAYGIGLTGVIFNPCDRVVINGDANSSVQALIEAHTVRINGEKFSIDNYPLEGTSIELALVE